MHNALNRPLFAALIALAALLSLSSFSFAYIDQSFSIYVKVFDDGNGTITEKTVFFLENEVERDVFDYYLRLGNTTLFDWQRFSKSIKYHFSGGVSDLKIVAAREFSIHPNAASVTLEYDARNITLIEKASSRITRYDLNTQLIALISPFEEIKAIS